MDRILTIKSELETIVESIITEPLFQNIINSNEFYFEELVKLYNVFKQDDISSFRTILSDFKEQKNFKFQTLLDENISNVSYYNFLVLIGKMVAIFDEKGYNKTNWNPYEDKRRICRATFTQQSWTYCFINFKLNNNSHEQLTETRFLPFKFCINYIEDAINNLPIVSHAHRTQISNYFKLDNETEIKDLFENYTNLVKNENNKTVFISCILYNAKVKKLWLDSIVALMTADGTGWQDEDIKFMQNKRCDAIALWNSRIPSGSSDTLKKVRELINEQGFINYYYTSKNLVNYKATVIDFVTNQVDLDNVNWISKFNKIANFKSRFDEYKGEKLEATIIFLASKLEKIKPISINNFEFYKHYSRPTQDNISPIKAEPENIITISSSLSINEQKMKHPLNQIFYGSPGTGKTYHTINYALSIIENKRIDELAKESREELKRRFDELLNEGRVVFTTFHQSMSYEDFIEGIKPIEPKEEGSNINYKVVNGIFKNICEQADSTKGNFYEVIKKFKDEVQEDDTKTPLTIKLTNTTFDIIYKGGTVFYVTPHNTTKLNPKYPVSIDFIEQYFNTNDLSGIYNTTYVKGIVEYLISNRNLVKGKNENNVNKPYVLIIDEINRGNVSAIFGELITLIEESKRVGNVEAIKLTLPYSKKKFGVPNNVYIIGTMNTADRSVEALDTALRRRFSFKEMQPKPELLSPQRMIWNYWWDNEKIGWGDEPFKTIHSNLNKLLGVEKDFDPNEEIWNKMEKEGKSETQIEYFNDIDFSGGINLETLLKLINSRIEFLLDKDHTIGHSFLINVLSVEELKETFFKNIIPLLQEYFYGDYAKMSLVIGEGFFEKNKSAKDISWAITNKNIDKPEKEMFILKQDLSIDEFKQAINLLLGIANETK